MSFYGPKTEISGYFWSVKTVRATASLAQAGAAGGPAGTPNPCRRLGSVAGWEVSHTFSPGWEVSQVGKCRRLGSVAENSHKVGKCRGPRLYYGARRNETGSEARQISNFLIMFRCEERTLNVK